MESKLSQETQEDTHLSPGTVGQHPNARVIHNTAELDALKVMQYRWGSIRIVRVHSVFA